MAKVTPQGYADITALQRSPALGSEPKKEHVLILCRQLSELLNPFALVDSTNERWRDEILALTQHVHDAAVALHIDDPTIETLSKGRQGLERYSSTIISVDSHEQHLNETRMDANELMNAMTEAIDRFVASSGGKPLDEWQMNNDLDLVDHFCRSVVFKLIQNDYPNEECNRADQLFTRVLDVYAAAEIRKDVSAPVNERLSRLAKNHQSRKERFAKARAKAKAMGLSDGEMG